MKITTDLLKSKIARRFCLLFFLCALLPTVCLFLVSFKRVTDELERQKYQELKQETRAYGFSLFDRLIRVDNTLRSLASTISSETISDSRTQEFLDTPANQLFEAIALYYEDGRSESFLGNITSEEAAVLIQEAQKEKKTRIAVRPGTDQVDRLVLIVPYILENELKFYLIGEVRPSYVWGIGAESLLPARTEFSVYGDTGKRIAGTVFSPGSEVDNFEREKVESDLRFFKYTVQDQKFLASAWMLFVRSNFANENWTIILSETENSHLSSLRGFKTTFFLITLLSLFLTLFLSLTFIRRTLNPLHLLKNGTERIARKDLSVILDINSGDEFEDLGKSFNSMTKQLHKQFNTLAAIDKIDRAILSSLDLPKVIDTSLKMLKDFFEADMIVLGQPVDSMSTTIKMHILEGKEEPAIELATLPESEQQQIFNQQPYTFIDKADFPQFLKTRGTSDYSQIVCLPLVFDKQFQSVLMFGHSTSRFHEQEELQLARQLADQVTIAISNAKLVTDLEKLILGTIEALARTVDAKSKWTAGHSERVSVLAGRIGKRMGYTEAQVDLLIRAGLLHDIGKIGVPIAILDKPGKLTEDEYTEVKNHSLIGKQILDPIEAYKNIIPLVAQHHERFDGTGYPYGIAGDDLDPLARILAVADVYDALVSSRPYREGWVLENARNFMLNGSGTQFDPKVVSAFMELAL